MEKKVQMALRLKKMQRIFISIPKTHWIIYHEIHSMLSVISVIILNALQVVISSKNKHGCFCPAKGMSQTSLSKLVSKRIQMRRISCFFSLFQQRAHLSSVTHCVLTLPNDTLFCEKARCVFVSFEFI